MNNWALIGLNVLLVAIEELAMFLLGNCFFQRKVYGIRFCASSLALFGASIIVYLLTSGMLGLKFIIIVQINAIWMYIVFQASFVKNLVVSMFIVSFMTLGDSVFTVLISLITSSDKQVYIQNPYGYYVLCFVTKIFELLGIVVLKLCMRRQSDLQAATWKDWLRTITFPALSVVIAVTLVQAHMAAHTLAPQVLTCVIVLVVADILAIILLNSLDEQQRELQDYAILKHASKQIQDSMDTWENAYNSQRRRTHEFQNHLAAIRGLAEREAPGGELVSYVERLLNEKQSYGLVVKTGRTAVDVVLSQKFGIAQSKGIELQFNLMNPADVMLPDEKFVLVLSNLLNNAIEACEKIPDPAQRKIWLTIQANAEVNFIIVRNTTAEPVRIWRGRVRTSKANAMAHGFGLQNVNGVLRHYGSSGVLTYDAETGIFAVSIQLIPQKE